jgi:hypothetical protein
MGKLSPFTLLRVSLRVVVGDRWRDFWPVQFSTFVSSPQIHFADDLIPAAADPVTPLAGTPANNDNPSQRNLAWV